MAMKEQLAANPKGIMIIVHGAMEHSGRYENLVRQWNESGYTCIYGDLPAHGETDGVKGHVDSFQEYMDAIIEWVRHATTFGLPIFLLGHSMGGLAVIRVLEENNVMPIEGVVLSSPCLGLVEPPSKAIKSMAKGLNVLAPKTMVDGSLNPHHLTRDTQAIRELVNDTLVLKKVSVRWYSELEKGMRLAFERMEAYPDIPTLVMQAGSDKIVDKVQTKKWFDTLNINEKSYKEWANLYHEIFNDPERKDVFHYAKGFVELHIPNT
ncbi:alpha/beta hydrolase [Pontibacillus salicampi]|uniref:Alpha/beta hydrolase n=1 Tax=Pontibacillus salicampi TaxID=1449801 RepID=A0ABV6LNS5_9BACI